MKPKFEKGTLFLCYSDHHVEKAHVIEIKGNIYTLNNRIQIDDTVKILNSKARGIKVEIWDSDKYDYLVAKSMMDKVLYKINSKYIDLEPDKLVRVYDRLNKLVEKYF